MGTEDLLAGREGQVLMICPDSVITWPEAAASFQFASVWANVLEEHQKHAGSPSLDRGRTFCG